MIPAIGLLPDMTLKYFKQMYFPSSSDKAIEEFRESLKEGAKSKNGVVPKGIIDNIYTSEGRIF